MCNVKFTRMYLGYSKLRLQNDVQTVGRPRTPHGNTVITIITYRALILISPKQRLSSLSISFIL